MKPVIIKTFNFKFENVSFTKLLLILKNLLILMTEMLLIKLSSTRNEENVTTFSKRKYKIHKITEVFNYFHGIIFFCGTILTQHS